MSVGERIKTARESAGLTQQELADRIYISRSYLARIEIDSKPATVPILKGIAHELGTTMDALAG